MADLPPQPPLANGASTDASGASGSAGASPRAPPPPPPFNTPNVGAWSTVGSGTSGSGDQAVQVLQSKLRGLNVREEDEEEDDGDDDDDEEMHLPPAVRRRVTALQRLQEKNDRMAEQYKAERAALEAKYKALYAPNYARRADIVSGKVEPTDDESGGAEAVAALAATEAESEDAAADDGEVGIPQFWAQAMLRHEAIQELVSEEDVECLKYLMDVKCDDKPDMKGFTLEFRFAENPWFTDAVLRKQYNTANIMDMGEPLIENVEGHDIAWKPRKNLCEKVIKSKPRKGRRGPQREGASKTVPRESFFKFFLKPVMYDPDEDDEDEAEETSVYNLNYEMDYEIALIFRNHLIPNAVHWFTGDAVEDEDEDDNDDEVHEGALFGAGQQGASSDDGDDGDDDDDDDGVEEIEDGDVGGTSAGDNPAVGGGANGENPECKQS